MNQRFLKILFPMLIMFIHLKAKDFMLVSLPRSGSTFLYKGICQSLKESKNNNEKMALEYFHINWQQNRKDIFQEWNTVSLNAYHERWKKSGYWGTKEIHALKRIPFFLTYFDCCILFRKRQHTFPARADFFESMYESFIENDHKEPILNEIKKYFVLNVKNSHQKQCAAYLVSWYIQLRSFQEKDVPIIDFEKLMRLDQKALQVYLRKKIPSPVDTKSLSSYIVSNRFSDIKASREYSGRLRYFFQYTLWGKDFWHYKEDAYRDLGIESYYKQLMTYMKTKDPHFRYWNLLS